MIGRSNLCSQASSATLWKSGHVGILQTVSEHPLTRTANKRRNLKLEPLDVPLVATVGARGRLTLPKAARDHLSLSEGDPVLVVVGSHWLQLVPADLISRDRVVESDGTDPTPDRVGGGRCGFGSLGQRCRSTITAEGRPPIHRARQLTGRMSISPEEDRIDRLLVTRQFALSHAGMTPFAAGHVDRCLALASVFALTSRGEAAASRMASGLPRAADRIQGPGDSPHRRLRGRSHRRPVLRADRPSECEGGRTHSPQARQESSRAPPQVSPRAPKTPPLPTGSARR